MPAMVLFFLWLVLIPYSTGLETSNKASNILAKALNASLPSRKVLRLEGDVNPCSKDSIVISQGPTGTLPDGIPCYSVTISNICVNGNSISDIHLHCGWFASTRLINPIFFKRLGYDNCLANNGRPLQSGTSIHFQYTNSFLFRLSVASAVVDK